MTWTCLLQTGISVLSVTVTPHVLHVTLTFDLFIPSNLRPGTLWTGSIHLLRWSCASVIVFVFLSALYFIIIHEYRPCLRRPTPAESINESISETSLEGRSRLLRKFE